MACLKGKAMVKTDLAGPQIYSTVEGVELLDEVFFFYLSILPISAFLLSPV